MGCAQSSCVHSDKTGHKSGANPDQSSSKYHPTVTKLAWTTTQTTPNERRPSPAANATKLFSLSSSSASSFGVIADEDVSEQKLQKERLKAKAMCRVHDKLFGVSEFETSPAEPPSKSLVLRVQAWLQGNVVVGNDDDDDDDDDDDEELDDCDDDDVHTVVGSTTSTLELSRSQRMGTNPLVPLRLTCPAMLLAMRATMDGGNQSPRSPITHQNKSKLQKAMTTVFTCTTFGTSEQ
eukprot:PhM_4_TR2053/c2_g1_i2/m.58018